MAGQCDHPSWNTVQVGTPDGYRTWCHSHGGYTDSEQPGFIPEERLDRYGRRA